jgi:aminobenzoyl-glutamate utilization protein B
MVKIRPLRERRSRVQEEVLQMLEMLVIMFLLLALTATTAPKGVPWHSWSVVASSGMSIGHKGMLHAAKALGMSMVDIYKDEKLRKEIKKEFNERIGDYNYDPYPKSWTPSY